MSECKTNLVEALIPPSWVHRLFTDHDISEGYFYNAEDTAVEGRIKEIVAASHEYRNTALANDGKVPAEMDRVYIETFLEGLRLVDQLERGLYRVCEAV